MALSYGFNLTESDMKSLLERIDKQQSGVRSWRQLFGNASLGYNAQSDALATDYASAIAEAYKSNFAQRNAIFGAGLSAGSTQQLLAQNRNDLHTAYETYVRNYSKDASALAESYAKEIREHDTALTERATNFANLYNSAYKYLSEELYGSTFTDINKNTSDYLTANNLGYALNDTVLKSWDELSHLLADSNGNLTAQGVEFFDQIFNATPQGYTRTDKDGNLIAVRSFDQWLSDTNPKLRTWAVGADTFNYTRAGTNFGTAKVLAGMESDDVEYHQGEYLTEDDAHNFTQSDFQKNDAHNFTQSKRPIVAASDFDSLKNGDDITIEVDGKSYTIESDGAIKDDAIDKYVSDNNITDGELFVYGDTNDIYIYNNDTVYKVTSKSTGEKYTSQYNDIKRYLQGESIGYIQLSNLYDDVAKANKYYLQNNDNINNNTLISDGDKRRLNEKNVKTYEKEISKLQQESVSIVKTTTDKWLNSVDAELRTLLGNTLYSELTQSDAYVSKLKAFNDAATNISNFKGSTDFKKRYEEYKRAGNELSSIISKFIEKHGYTGKTSGF